MIMIKFGYIGAHVEWMFRLCHPKLLSQYHAVVVNYCYLYLLKELILSIKVYVALIYRPLHYIAISNNYWIAFVQMRTHSNAGGDGANEPLPNPPPMNQGNFFEHFLGEMRNIASAINQGRGAGPANQYSSFKDFMDTRPNQFREAAEPLEADEWITSIQNRFRMLRLSEGLKTEYAAHLLEGPAGLWWTNYRATFSEGTEIPWAQFVAAFHENYIPPGLMAQKMGEFIRLSQGSKSLTEYLQAFNNLARYAPDMVDTDEKKIASFKRGMSPQLLKYMNSSEKNTFPAFVSDCLTQETTLKACEALDSRKRHFEGGSSQVRAPPQHRPSYRPPAPRSARPTRRPQPQFNNNSRYKKATVTPF